MDYTELIVTVPAADREPAEAAVLAYAAGGIYTEDYSDVESVAPLVGGTPYLDEELAAADRSVCRIHAYFTDPAGLPAAREGIGQRLWQLGIAHTAEVVRAAGADWENEWKKYYHPVRAGKRLVITPAWQQPELCAGDIAVRIDPGMAFGSGLHETTRLAAARLEQTIRGGEQLLDMGCGSGVLAIAGLLLGAGHAAAADVTQAALTAAAHNAALNGVSDRLTVMLPADAFRSSAYDIIIANIIADIIIGYAARFYASLRKGGTLITSGIIDGRADDTRRALELSGFRFVSSAGEGEWHELTFQKL